MHVWRVYLGVGVYIHRADSKRLVKWQRILADRSIAMDARSARGLEPLIGGRSDANDEVIPSPVARVQPQCVYNRIVQVGPSDGLQRALHDAMFRSTNIGR